jgi:hypothetical protein
MKPCSTCKEIKSLDEFQKRSSNKDGHTNMCKICKREYDNAHYKNSYGKRKNYIQQNRKRARKEADDYILEYLLLHPCVDCGESDPIVLEFDHVLGEKKQAISNLKRNGKNSIIKEIEKCEVRCANCHRRKTAKQFGWTNKMPS